MGKCIGCNKKIGFFEGYSTGGEEFCNDCYPKRKEILDKKKTEKRKKEKEEREKFEKEDFREEEAKKILKLNNSKLRDELIHKRAKKLNKEKIGKLISKIEKYRTYKLISKVIFFAGILLWLILYERLIIGFPLLIFVIVSWFINSSRKSSLISELKKLEIV